MSALLQRVHDDGTHVIAWLENGVIQIKAIAEADLKAEHDALVAMIRPADPANHAWPAPHLLDSIGARIAALRSKINAFIA